MRERMFTNMYKKRCATCGKVCYSLSAAGRWFCPGCGADLTLAPLVPRDRSTANILPFNVPDEDGPELN